MSNEVGSLTDFSSLAFLAFVALTFAIYRLTGQQFRKPVLLAASYVFYGSHNVQYVPLLFGLTLLNFAIANRIHRNLELDSAIGRLKLLCLGANLGALFLFKYLGLFSDMVSGFILPLGISFFSLQSIGYVLDVSRTQIKPEANFTTFALFVSFFPQIIAGPIARGSELLPQFHSATKQGFSKLADLQWKRAGYLFAYGFFKKFVVADNLAHVLQHFDVEPHTSLITKQITLLYFLMRIYCDFSGYSDMARGIALLFGIQLGINFNFPLFAQSPSEFWDRWHISLGNWIRRYFYVPLLVRTFNPYLALFIVFPTMGLWHGANLNYFTWGFCWAALIALYKMAAPTFGTQRGRKVSYLSIFAMLNLAALLMVFYKAENQKQLLDYLSWGRGSASSSSLAEDWELLRVVAILPMFILGYEFLLYRRSTNPVAQAGLAEKEAYLGVLEKSWLHQFIFYLAIGLLSLYFSKVSSQAIFYMQY